MEDKQGDSVLPPTTIPSPILRDYNAADVEMVIGILLRHGEFGSTGEASRRMASICAHELLAALSA
jgi:hypothetical protein